MELLARVRAGEPAALDEFVQRMRCIPRILASKNRRLALGLDPGDLDDLAQEVLAAVWARLGTFEGRSTLESWVYGFCVQKLMNALKRLAHRPRAVGGGTREPAIADRAPREPGARRETCAAPVLVDPALADPALDTGRRADAVRLYACIGSLDPIESEAIRLKHFEGLTFEELAARTGVSPNTAKTRYYRGIERLRVLLGRRFGGEGGA